MKQEQTLKPTGKSLTKSGALIPDSSTQTPQEQVAKTKQELAKYEVEGKQTVTITDPFTGESKDITLDRTGHHEQKLILALTNPNFTQERKDHELSMYLFERGRESSSMLVDLWRYKGTHTKEDRLFQSRMRFDFEMFVGLFIGHLKRRVETIEKIFDVNIEYERQKFKDFVSLPGNKEKGLTYHDRNGDTETRDLLIALAINDLDEAERLRSEVDKVTRAREAQQGGGIYVGRGGQVYNVNDPAIMEIIKKDQKLQEEVEKGTSHAI